MVLARSLTCWVLLIALLAGAACSSPASSTWVLIDRDTWDMYDKTDSVQVQSWDRSRPALTGSAIHDEMNNAYLWRSSSHGVRHGYRADESMTPVATLYAEDESHSFAFDGATDLGRAGYGWLAVRYGGHDAERPWYLWDTSTKRFAPLSLPDQGPDLGQGWLAITTDGYVAAIRDLRLSLYTINGEEIAVPEFFDDARIVGVTPVLSGSAVLVQYEPDDPEDKRTGGYVWQPGSDVLKRVTKESRPTVYGKDRSILFVPSDVWPRPHRLVEFGFSDDRSDIETRSWGPRGKDVASMSPDLSYMTYMAPTDWLGKTLEERLLRLAPNGSTANRMGPLPDGSWEWFNTNWIEPGTPESVGPPVDPR